MVNTKGATLCDSILGGLSFPLKLRAGVKKRIFLILSPFLFWLYFLFPFLPSQANYLTDVY